MASKTDIVNKALRLLGAETVTDISDDVPEAQVAATFYDDTKIASLQYAPWSFAQKRTSIAKDSTAPAWGYDARFKLPQDFLQLVEIENSGPNDDYRVEGQYLLINGMETLNMVYTANIEEGLMSGIFVEALAAALAENMAADITESNTKTQMVAALRQQRLDKAETMDWQQRSNQRTRTQGYFRRSRKTMGVMGGPTY